MRAAKHNLKKFRIQLATVGILSVAALARQIGCSRPAIYFALARPSRFPRVHKKIQEVLGHE